MTDTDHEAMLRAGIGLAAIKPLIAAREEAAQARHAEVARSQPFYPGTLTGRRQAWLREAIARRIEGREPPEAPPLDDRPLVEATRREERKACALHAHRMLKRLLLDVTAMSHRDADELAYGFAAVIRARGES